MTEAHTPVMLAEVVEVLNPRNGGLYVDGTFGAGGYARAILDSADCAVIGIDRDVRAVDSARSFSKRYGERLTVLHGRFGDMEGLLESRHVREVDGVALDLGVSSMQLDESARGFSFLRDGPLDMRMDPESGGESAADVVNAYAEGDLARIIAVYGEERRARAVARAIVAARAKTPLTRTGALAEVITGVLGAPRADRIHPATRTFQGLRIYVNDELGELARGLEAAERMLRPSGRLAVVAFHSLEDRMVKQFLAGRSGAGRGTSRHLPQAPVRAPSFKLVWRGARKPSESETARNPRARSARLRAAERTSARPWSDSQPHWEGRRA